MPLPILTANTQYTAALIDLQKKKTLLTKRSSKMDIFDTTSQEVVKATNDIAKEVEALEPVSEDREKTGKQLVEIKVSLRVYFDKKFMYDDHVLFPLETKRQLPSRNRPTSSKVPRNQFILCSYFLC